MVLFPTIPPSEPLGWKDLFDSLGYFNSFFASRPLVGAENAGYVAPSSTTLENWTSTTVPMAAASPAAMLWLVAQVVLL